jgi:hypothetical protein
LSVAPIAYGTRMHGFRSDRPVRRVQIAPRL